ncbi:hypothetical protein JXA32_03755 [Candidatus Sumerlaeota bacterium]|nr:hypothetical protein [Candidatus Sumerlaeota bacterium]
MNLFFRTIPLCMILLIATPVFSLDPPEPRNDPEPSMIQQPGGASVSAVHITALQLIDIETNRGLRELSANDTINLLQDGSCITLEATTDNPVSCLRFSLNDEENYYTDSDTPFAIAGDTAAVFNPWNDAAVGHYDLTLTPYQEDNGVQRPGLAHEIDFRIIKLPAPWQLIDIGEPLPKALADYTVNDEHLLIAAGTPLTSGTDAMAFIHQPFNDVWILAARLLSTDAATSHAVAGIMLREDQTPDCNRVFFGLDAQNQLLFDSRMNEIHEQFTQDGLRWPLWIRMRRQAPSHYCFEYSNDGEQWQTFQSASLNFSSSPLTGIAATSQQPGAIAKFTLDQLIFLLTPNPDSVSLSMR